MSGGYVPPSAGSRRVRPAAADAREAIIDGHRRAQEGRL